MIKGLLPQRQLSYKLAAKDANSMNSMNSMNSTNNGNSAGRGNRFFIGLIMFFVIGLNKKLGIALGI